MEHGAAPTWRQPWRHPNTNLAPSLAPTQIWSPTWYEIQYRPGANLAPTLAPPQIWYQTYYYISGSSPKRRYHIPEMWYQAWYQMRYHLLGLDRSLPSVILYIGKTSSITAGANLGGGQEDLVPEVVQPFWGWYQIWYHGLVPDVVPPFGAGTKDVVPGLVPDVVQQPFQKIYQIWIMVWYQGLVPDVVPLFGTGTRDVVSGLVPPFWGWNERCGTRRVAQPFWAGTGSGTRAWYLVWYELLGLEPEMW